MIRFLVTLADKRKVLAYANSKADFLSIRSSLARYRELPELGDNEHLRRFYIHQQAGRDALAAEAWRARNTYRQRGELVTMQRGQVEIIANALASPNNQDLVQRAKTILKRRGFASCDTK